MIDEIIRRGSLSTPLQPEPEPQWQLPTSDGASQFASTLQWLLSVKLEACHAVLAGIGYGEDLDLLVEGDDSEIAEILASVEQLAVDDKRDRPKVKKFKRELSKLRGRGEQFV